jgi:hypothetical protein
LLHDAQAVEGVGLAMQVALVAARRQVSEIGLFAPGSEKG